MKHVKILRNVADRRNTLFFCALRSTLKLLRAMSTNTFNILRDVADSTNTLKLLRATRKQVKIVVRNAGDRGNTLKLCATDAYSGKR